MFNTLSGTKVAYSLSRARVRQIALSIFFLLSFSTFKYFPGMSLTSEIWFAVIFIFLITMYAYRVVSDAFKITLLEVYAFVIIVYVPIVAACMANNEFGQPLIYGLLSQRGVILVGCTIMLLHFFRTKYFSLQDVEQALVGLAWFTLVLYSSIQFAFDPSQFSENSPGFAVGGEVDEAKFAFDKSFIIFGFYYYAYEGYWKKSNQANLMALIFFMYLLIAGGGRSLLVAMLLSYLFFIWRWSSTAKFLRLLLKLSVVAGILLSIILITDGEKLLHLFEKFSQAFLVIFTGEEGDDASANARIVESVIAIPYIFKHWLLGNGVVSNQWNDGYKSILGYFYPTDIGLIGVLFTFGLLGFILFMGQFYFVLRYSNALPKNGGKLNKLVSATKGFLLYYAIHSVVTGRFANSVEIGLLFIAILYCAAQFEPPEKLQLKRRALS